MIAPRSALLLTAFTALSVAWLSGHRPADYDPLNVPKELTIRKVDLVVHDGARRRDLPVLVYMPARETPQPVVLFSHGLGGSRHGSSYLGEHWAKRGYVAVFLQHPGSDTQVWRGVPLAQRREAMNRAASPENLRLRAEDVHAVLDALGRWNKEKSQLLYERLDMSAVGMSGHSFGARTTQIVSGEVHRLWGTKFLDTRIRAAVIFSPSSPLGMAPAEAFGSVRIPWLLMTGTRDVAPIGGQDVESRLRVFPALPPGDKYELVLHDAQHSAFTDASRLDRGFRNPNHHRAILAISTAFWDAYLRHDTQAQQWLRGDVWRGVLEKKDRWQKK